MPKPTDEQLVQQLRTMGLKYAAERFEQLLASESQLREINEAFGQALEQSMRERPE